VTSYSGNKIFFQSSIFETLWFGPKIVGVEPVASKLFADEEDQD
jgi:hypothetical protein